MDPIRYIIGNVLTALHQFISLYPTHEAKIFVSALLVGLVIMVIWSICQSTAKDSEKLWSDTCATIMDRIGVLYPIYADTVKRYCDTLVHEIENDKQLCRLAANTPDKFNIEMEFLAQSAADREQMIALISQLKFLKGAK